MAVYWPVGFLVGLDGESRELHIKKSIETIDFEGIHSTETTPAVVRKEDGTTHNLYVENDYFSLETIEVEKCFEGDRIGAFEIYIVLEGKGLVKGDFESLEVKKGDSLIIPNSVSRYIFDGTMTLLKTYVPSEA